MVSRDQAQSPSSPHGLTRGAWRPGLLGLIPARGVRSARLWAGLDGNCRVAVLLNLLGRHVRLGLGFENVAEGLNRAMEGRGLGGAGTHQSLKNIGHIQCQLSSRRLLQFKHRLMALRGVSAARTFSFIASGHAAAAATGCTRIAWTVPGVDWKAVVRRSAHAFRCCLRPVHSSCVRVISPPSWRSTKPPPSASLTSTCVPPISLESTPRGAGGCAQPQTMSLLPPKSLPIAIFWEGAIS